MSIRSIFILCAAAGLAACAAQKPAPFSAAEACSVSGSNYESRDVQCQFPKAQAGRKFLFKANFSGGHDDTVARLQPTLNDVPLECDEGSKVHLIAEDGDVSLWCSFAVAGNNPQGDVFKVKVYFSHAQYVNYEVAAQ